MNISASHATDANTIMTDEKTDNLDKTNSGSTKRESNDGNLDITNDAPPRRRKSRRVGFGKMSDSSIAERNTQHISQLAEMLVTGKNVVFLTGAGISVASGIKPFRGQEDAVWHESVMEWGTRAKFEKDPLEWYNTFWLHHFDETKKDSYKPNDGHLAIEAICKAFPKTAKVITQNIDSLHRLDDSQLIEVHGTASRYKCIVDGCKYSENYDFELHSGLNLVITNGHSRLADEKDIPRCPECNSRCLPNCLLFDEDYASHVAYRFQEAQDWLEAAHAIVFVGTSFSVQITGIALQFANLSGDKQVFDFNVNPQAIPSSKASRVTVLQVIGPSEKTLKQLGNSCT